MQKVLEITEEVVVKVKLAQARVIQAIGLKGVTFTENFGQRAQCRFSFNEDDADQIIAACLNDKRNVPLIEAEHEDRLGRPLRHPNTQVNRLHRVAEAVAAVA